MLSETGSPPYPHRTHQYQHHIHILLILIPACYMHPRPSTAKLKGHLVVASMEIVNLSILVFVKDHASKIDYMQVNKYNQSSSPLSQSLWMLLLPHRLSFDQSRPWFPLKNLFAIISCGKLFWPYFPLKKRTFLPYIISSEKPQSFALLSGLSGLVATKAELCD